MKKIYFPVYRSVVLCLFAFFSIAKLSAQCNVNDKYDKIISGYHSSIALKDNGVYAIWGSFMQKTGAADQLSPQDMNATNYTGLTGTIYKAALGGQSAGAQVDQGILLTSDGLWAWGVTAKVLSTTIKATATFGRITSPSGGVGSTALGLPTGVNPTDVESMFATFQTLILVTKIVSGVGGDVYVLTQTSRAVEANGGVVTTAGQSSWQKVKTGASTYLTNVTAARGQVYNISNNAFIAITSSGQAYTWGNTSYLGNGTAIAARNYATSMTLPSEFSSSVPKMIGVTGGGGTGATTVTNSYYILSNAGNIYSLGNNSQKQCGDFTAIEKTSWVQVKKSAAANDYLTNINFFSCQEHNASFPTVAAITTTGSLYTWGNNSSGMAGRTDDGTAGGTLTTVSFDPGIPVGFTGTAISVEVGGHTMVYTKTGSTQFCYVGHYTNGSMGDGTSNNNGASSAASLKHDCSSTPAITICGYVPVTGSTVNSTINASLISIQANGSATSVVTVQLKDASGTNLTASGGTVVISTSDGTLGTVTDNNNGTYTVTLTSSLTPGTATISYTLNGVAGINTVQVQFTSSTLPLSWLSSAAYRQNRTIKIAWTTAQELNISHFEIDRSADGITWYTIINDVPANNLTPMNHYKQTDNEYTAGRTYYRIRQYDIDGRFTYSPVLMVPADNGSNKISIYPVPVYTAFQLSNAIPDEIKQVDVYMLNGSKVRSWKLFRSSYDVQDIPQGIYIVRIETADGNVQNIKMNKR